MDEEFIAPRELILAGVGIGVALLLLVILSLLQKFRLRREGEERLRTLESESAGMMDSAPGTIPFFIACYEGGNARFFRVYLGQDELLFVNAGQYFALIDVESPRGTDQRHWLLRSLKLIWVGLAGGAVAAGIGVAVLLRAVAKNATKNPEGARDIMLIVFGVIGFLAVMVVVGVPLMLWQVTRRCRQLNPMSLARLRQEAELDRKSFRATPETVTEFKVALLDQRENFISSQEVGSTITFKDSVTGRWKITTRATSDTRAALQAFRSLWGGDRVFVDDKLRERLGETIEESAASRAASETSATWLQGVLSKAQVPAAAPGVTPPRYGFPLYMLVGCAVGACLAVAIAFIMAGVGGRFSYTGLGKLVFGLGGGGTYLGHVAGCLRHKEAGINPFGPLTPGIGVAGAAMWFIGSGAAIIAVLGIMTAIYGPPPH